MALKGGEDREAEQTLGLSGREHGRHVHYKHLGKLRVFDAASDAPQDIIA